MYASLMYTLHHSAPAAIPGQPNQFEHLTATTNGPTNGITTHDTPTANAETATQQQAGAASAATAPADALNRSNSPVPDPPAVFTNALRELARDLIVKEQQIEALISSLPGIGTSEQEQVERIAELERQLREVEKERKEAAKEKRDILRRLDERIVRVKIP